MATNRFSHCSFLDQSRNGLCDSLPNRRCLSGHLRRRVRRRSPSRPWKTALLVTLGLATAGYSKKQAKMPATSPWNLDQLTTNVPEMQWEDAEAEAPQPVRPLTFAGEAFKGFPTSVFAWYASPATLDHSKADSKFPGIVLVHGGGDTAFRQWASRDRK